IGGIIVIDFIDMVLESNRDLVLRRLIECLARDRTKHQVAEVTSLGLVQMTRKRVGSGLLAAFSAPCEHCNGRGVLVSTELTEIHSHGRNGQLSPTPKPGLARSRSARSKAIAEVAAKTLEPQQAGGDEAAQPAAPDGQVQEPAIAEPVVADLAPAESATSEPKADTEAAAKSASARSGSRRTRRSEPAASRERTSATPASAATEVAGTEQVASTEQAASTEQVGVQVPDGDSAPEAPPRGRVRRSAYREAGPPDSALADASAPPKDPQAADGATTEPDAVPATNDAVPDAEVVPAAAEVVPAADAEVVSDTAGAMRAADAEVVPDTAEVASDADAEVVAAAVDAV